MNKDSIIFTITTTFMIALVLVLVSFGMLYKVSEKREEHSMAKRSMEATKMFLRDFRHHGLTQELEEGLRLIDHSIISDLDQQREILNDPNIQYVESHVRARGRVKVQRLRLHDRHYVYIETREGDVILEDDNRPESHKGAILIVFAVIFLTFVSLYLTTLKKLRPLNTLKEKVQDIGDEEFDISCASDKKDEISLLANEFDRSAKKLKKIKAARNVFIRNIMHELKTPITKGKFLIELPQTEENTTKMQKVFYRLESLINEFASIEELISTNKGLAKREYYLIDIIDNAMDILFVDQDSVIIEDMTDVKVSVDLRLFTIIMKNLIDNGIKYSEDGLVFIRCEDKKIYVSSRGEGLRYDLENYLEPFFKGDLDAKEERGFGLGLYIVNEIMLKHGFDFSYEYKGNENIFVVDHSDN